MTLSDLTMTPDTAMYSASTKGKAGNGEVQCPTDATFNRK